MQQKDQCIVCLESNAEIIARINIHSSEWNECHIRRIIEKHLWWWYLRKPPDDILQWICRQCWQEISSFHNFYLTVENVHKKCQPFEKMDKGNMIGGKEVPNENYTCVLGEDLVPLQTPQRKSMSRNLEKKNTAEIKNDEYFVTDYEEDVQDQCLDKELSIDTFNIVSEHCLNNDYDNEFRIALVDDSETKLSSKIKITKVRHRDTKQTKSIKRDHFDDSVKRNNSTLDELFLNQNELECNICNEKLHNFSKLKTHFRNEHNTTGYAVCCGKKFMNQRLLIDHINVHKNPEYFKCPDCNKTFKLRYCYNKHLQTHLTRERKFNCKECGKSFHEQKYFKLHILTHVPANERTLPCKQCDKKFASELHLKQHEEIHEKKYFKICDICGKSFRDNFSFQRHMNDHAGIATSCQNCDICGLKLVNKSALTQHIKNIHGDKNNVEYICSHCSKVSPNMRAHRHHIEYIHTMERKNACHLCDKKFRRPLELKEHISTHTGEPLYTCPHCPRTFISNANMHKHRKIAHRTEWEQGRLKKFNEPRRKGGVKNVIQNSSSNETAIQ